ASERTPDNPPTALACARFVEVVPSPSCPKPLPPKQRTVRLLATIPQMWSKPPASSVTPSIPGKTTGVGLSTSPPQQLTPLAARTAQVVLPAPVSIVAMLPAARTATGVFESAV